MAWLNTEFHFRRILVQIFGTAFKLFTMDLNL